MSKKLTELTALGGAPAATDLIPLVDVSDTTDGPSGTTKTVTRDQLYSGISVSTAKIEDAAVTAAKLGASAVTEAALQDGAVTFAKLSPIIGYRYLADTGHLIRLDDAGKLLDFDSASPQGVDVPEDASFDLPILSTVRIHARAGGGGVTIYPESGSVTVLASSTAVQAGTTATLLKVGANTWLRLSALTGSAIPDGDIGGSKLADEAVTPEKTARIQYIAAAGTTRTITATDLEQIVACSNAAGCAVTLPDDAGENLDVGFGVIIYAEAGSGGVTVSAGGSGALEGSGTIAAGSSGGFIKRGANNWVRLS